MHELQAKDHTPTAPPIHEGRVSPGATGLSNLGNTCFMNSALQCVSNAQPLTQYFLEKDHLLEINKYVIFITFSLFSPPSSLSTPSLLWLICRDNPLGMGGVMAKRYSDLINELWSGNSRSITPLKFRVSLFVCCCSL